MRGIRFAHDMPFGAEVREDGRVRFRLWAPAAPAVAVQLPRSGRRLPMESIGDGWFETVTDAARPADEYRFELADATMVPDPASRRQKRDVHGTSVVVDPRAYAWRRPDWCGRPWHETVLYELHVGTFTPVASFDGARRRLQPLAELGVTAIELMPVADFSGRWNWGYDGVLPFAPDASYGTPEQLKELIDAAHDLGLMVFLDVVYNHFGPDGNYLALYAPQFFTERRRTPWGAAIDYTQPAVRQFFIHNALFWIQEYRFDGLRLDAAHEIVDDSPAHLLAELAQAVRETVDAGRHVHLVLENDDNAAHLIERDADARPRHFTAQWNDDFHHAAHVVLTGETAGYYVDYADNPASHLGRTLAEGFAYQGEFSPHRGRRRGTASVQLPAPAFVNFLQNHDQVGNRAFGERLTTLAEPAALLALSGVLLLAPSVPLLFMDEEFGARQPFRFFTDFSGEIARAVREGRRREFARFPAFADPATRDTIPDPQAEATYRGSVSTTLSPDDPAARAWYDHYRRLIAIRHREIVPRLAEMRGGRGEYAATADGQLTAKWVLGDGARLTLTAHLARVAGTDMPPAAGRCLWATHPDKPDRLPPWFAAWFLDDDVSR